MLWSPRGGALDSCVVSKKIITALYNVFVKIFKGENWPWGGGGGGLFETLSIEWYCVTD